MLRKCPHHGLPIWHQVQAFNNGLNYSTKQLIDAAAGGSINYKSPKQCLQLFDDMANNHYQWSSTRSKDKKPTGIYEINEVAALSLKVEALTKMVNGIVPQGRTTAPVNYSHGDGSEDNQVEQVDYL